MNARGFMVAVESSGETLGLSLFEALEKHKKHAIAWTGVVGDRLVARGVQPVAEGDCIAVVGIVEVLGKLGQIRSLMRAIESHIQTTLPDFVVLIDHPEFNLRLARFVKSLGIPVIYYVSPQIWAWRKGRIKKIKKLVDHMMVLFPFEKQVYQEAGIPVSVVAHPLLAKVRQAPNKEEARISLQLPGSAQVVAMLPGSRVSEVRKILPRMAAAATTLYQKEGIENFIVPVAHRKVQALIQEIWQNHAPDVPVQLVDGQAAQVVRAADAVAVASGTASLETALLGRPAVVVYAVHPLTYAIGKRLIRVSHIALPNLIMDQRIYPELIQGAFTGQALAHELFACLGEAGAAQVQSLAALPSKMQGESAQAMVEIVENILARKQKNR